MLLLLLGFRVFDSIRFVLSLVLVLFFVCMQCRPLFLVSCLFSLSLSLLSLSLASSLHSIPQQQPPPPPPPPEVSFQPLPPVPSSVPARPCPSFLPLPCFFFERSKNDDDGEVLVFKWLCADGLGVGGDCIDSCSALPSPLSPLPHIRARWRLRRIENTALFSVNGLWISDGLVAIALPPDVRG